MHRLDDAPWRRIHARILLVLGIGWALDSFEVQIIGSILQPLAEDFGLSTTEQTVHIWVVWFLGLMIGAMGFGYLADRVGRKRLFVATLILYATATVLSAASPTFEVFLFFRFLTALGVGGEYSAVTSAIAEFMPSRVRGRTTTVTMNFWSIGGIVAGLVGLFALGPLTVLFEDELGIAGWRGALLIGAAAAAYGLYARRAIPESPRWLASRGRVEEADGVIASISGLPSTGRVDLVDRSAAPTFRSQLGELFSPAYRWRSVFGMTLDFSATAAYYGIFTFLPVFVLTEGVVEVDSARVPYYYLIANIGALVAGFTTAELLERLGRGPTVFGGFTLAAGTVLLLAGAAESGSPGLTLAAFTLAVFAATCCWMSAYTTLSEIFPTHLRASGMGLSVGVGRIGGMVGVVGLALAAPRFGLFSGFLLLAALWLLGGIAAGLWWRRGQEGRGRTLEELAPPRERVGARDPG